MERSRDELEGAPWRRGRDQDGLRLNFPFVVPAKTYLTRVGHEGADRAGDVGEPESEPNESKLKLGASGRRARPVFVLVCLGLFAMPNEGSISALLP